MHDEDLQRMKSSDFDNIHIGFIPQSAFVNERRTLLIYIYYKIAVVVSWS